MPGPLDGIRVLDFTRFQQGTFGTAQLGDLGADIWKIEQPGGDPGRTLGRHLIGYSSYFESLNRNKRSLCLDLSKPGGGRWSIAWCRRWISSPRTSVRARWTAWGSDTTS